jgi:hypothetical protein
VKTSATAPARRSQSVMARLRPGAAETGRSRMEQLARLCVALAGLNPHDLKFVEDGADDDEWDRAIRGLAAEHSRSLEAPEVRLQWPPSGRNSHTVDSA